MDRGQSTRVNVTDDVDHGLQFPVSYMVMRQSHVKIHGK